MKCKPHTVRRRLDGLESVQKDGRSLVYDSAEALSRYYLRESLDLTRERARLAKEQADAQALKNAEARDELVPIGEVEEVMFGLVSIVVQRLDAIPSKAGPEVRATRTDAEAAEVLRRFIDEARLELADKGERLASGQSFRS